MSTQPIFTCDTCGQRNRAPLAPLTATQSLRCGACHETLAGPDADDDEADVADWEGGQS